MSQVIAKTVLMHQPGAQVLYQLIQLAVKHVILAAFIISQQETNVYFVQSKALIVQELTTMVTSRVAVIAKWFKLAAKLVSIHHQTVSRYCQLIKHCVIHAIRLICISVIQMIYVFHAQRKLRIVQEWTTMVTSSRVVENKLFKQAIKHAQTHHQTAPHLTQRIKRYAIHVILVTNTI